MSTTAKVRLFVYGLLKPDYDPPKSATDIRHDSVRGKLYDLKSDAAMTHVGETRAPWCRGYSMLVEQEEYQRIVKFEAPQYRPTTTEAWSGERVIVFEYRREIPEELKPIRYWHLAEKHKGRKAAARSIKA